MSRLLTNAEIAERSLPECPAPTKCPECGSLECGPVRCRFTMKPREFHDYRDTPRQYGPQHDLDLVGRPLKAGS